MSLLTKKEDKTSNNAVEKNETETHVEKVKRPVFSPSVSVYSDETTLYLEASLPGVSEKSVAISLEKDVLKIEGEYDLPELKGYELKYSEFRKGNYQRSFQIHESVETENIEAVVKNGILRLRLPLKKPVSTKIEVKAE